jgi:hypothetical protein
MAIVKLHLNPEKWGLWNLRNLKQEALDDGEVKYIMTDAIITNCQNHLKCDRIAYTWCGDQIKYDSRGQIEWIFWPRYCWYDLPEETRNEITMNDYHEIFMENITADCTP